MNQLRVHFQRRFVGLLYEVGASLHFRYDPAWLSGGEYSFPISISMPLSNDIYTDVAQAWFANLLPEGRQRVLVAQRLKISDRNEFELLKALGGECAGALTLDDGEAVAAHAPDGRFIQDSDIERWIRNRRDLPLIDTLNDVRLSLAGAQDKLPVIVKDDSIYLPAHGTPSTHILKLPDTEFKQLPENEYFTTKLAQAFGLRVHDISLRKIGKAYVSLARRYDRHIDEQGVIQRLHQEDFCQAKGYPSFKKYEAEGGPSLASCIQLAAEQLPHPAVTIDQMLRWTIFNILVGNCDAHAKNLSFVWQSNGQITLAPFYDLVSTLAYKGLSRKMAQSIGSEADPAAVRKTHWQSLARAVSITPKTLLDDVAQACDQLLALFQPTLAAMQDQGIRFTKAADVEKVLRKQTRRIREGLV